MEEMKLCECGCEEAVAPGRRFIRGHNTRIRSKELIEDIANKRRGRPRWVPRETRFCECGCGETFECKENSKQRFILGHSSCGENNGSYGKIYSEEERRRWSEMTKGEKNPFYGKSHTEEAKHRMSKSRSGENSWWWGRKHTKETKEKMAEAREGKTWEEFYGIEKAEEVRKKRILARSNQIFPKKDTSIEKSIQELLNLLKLEYFKHKTLKSLGFSKDCECPNLLLHQIDLVLSDYKLIIECDGDYWHCYPYGKVKDFYINKIVKENGWDILRFWERDIKNYLHNCRMEILQKCEEV